MSRSRSFCLLAAALSLPAAFILASPPRETLSSSLSSDSLSLRWAYARDASRIVLGLDARDGLSQHSGCLELVSPANPRLRLAAGPGSPSGSLRFLADPVSSASLAASPSVDIDSSLRSRRAALGLDAGPLSLFAFGEGEGPVAFSSRSCAGRSLGAGSGGCSLELAALGVTAELIGAASFPEERKRGEGWSPDPASSPSLRASEGGSPLFDAALVVRRSCATSSALAAAACSWGRLAGGAAAFRLETSGRAGPLELALRASSADARFRTLFGGGADKLLSASADARLDLAGSSRLSVSLSSDAESRGARYAPLWGGEGSASLCFPLVIDSGRVFETSFAERRGAEGETDGCWSCAIKRRAERDRFSESASLSSKLRWAAGIEGLDLTFASELEGRRGLPSFGLELSLKLFDKGLSSSPVVAQGGASLSLPFGEGGIITLEAALPRAGVELSPRVEGDATKAPEFSLHYKARVAVR